MADGIEKTIREIPIRREQTDRTAVFYANDSWVGQTKWDLQVSFGRLPAFPPMKTADEMPGQVVIQADATVIMTYEHAKAFIKTLAKQLDKMEQMRSILNSDIEEEHADE